MDTQKERHTYGFWDKTKDTYQNYEGADELLTSLGIDENQKILIFQPYAPNIPLTLMNRKGYSSMSTNKERLALIIDWDYDYLVLQNEFFLSEIYPKNQNLINKFIKIYDNGNISICKRKDNTQTLNEFVGLEKTTPFLSYELNFDSDSVDYSQWENIQLDTAVKFSGSSSMKTDKRMEYSIAFTDSVDLSSKDNILYFEGIIKLEELKSCTITIAINDQGENKFYKTLELDKLVTQNKEWQSFQFQFNLPEIKSKKSELKLYFYNGNNNEFYMDDCSLKLYQNHLYNLPTRLWFYTRLKH